MVLAVGHNVCKLIIYYLLVIFMLLKNYYLYRTPYDQNSIVGHIISHLTQTAGITAIVAFLCPTTTTYFAVCSYIEALFIDLAIEQNQIDEHFEETPRRICVLFMKKRLVDLIHSHNEVIR